MDESDAFIAISGNFSPFIWIFSLFYFYWSLYFCVLSLWNLLDFDLFNFSLFNIVSFYFCAIFEKF